MLTLEIEFLTGVCFAARSNSETKPDWPPQPDRVFSALTAAWGARGERDGEKQALEWLEAQPPPTLAASSAENRRVGISYVPPNDAGGGELTAIPDRRSRQARTFPAAVPATPVMHLRWALEPGHAVLSALQSLAEDTAYLGHSSSLVRCRFSLADANVEVPRAPARRRVYEGRLAELTDHFRSGRRPSPGVEIISQPASVHSLQPAAGVFGREWIVLEGGDGACPDLRAIAVVARRLRDAIMSNYSGPPPEALSGHREDGSPSRDPHLAVVPLADVGFGYSEGRLMGLALVVPRTWEEEYKGARRRQLAGLADPSGLAATWTRLESAIEATRELKLGSLGVWMVRRIAASEKRSLETRRYLTPSKIWASVTPIALDRHPKAKDPASRDAEIEAIVAAACVNTGLPEPVRIRAAKHSAVRGSPSAYPSGNGPVWTGWTLPGPLQGRLLTHVVLEFGQEVSGPILLGAGRFAGLGLCLPLSGESFGRT